MCPKAAFDRKVEYLTALLLSTMRTKSHTPQQKKTQLSIHDCNKTQDPKHKTQNTVTRYAIISQIYKLVYDAKGTTTLSRKKNDES